MTLNNNPLIKLIALALLMPALTMAAPELSSPGSLSFTFENDILSPQHTDRHYTNGIQITKTSRSYDQFDDSNTFGWLAKSASLLPLGKGEWLKHRTTLSLGQVMQTPEDITTSEPDPNDVPYGGILYAGHGLETFARHHADYLDIIVGITGKPALAGQAQILIHKSTGSEPPQGWDHQIPTELLLNVYYSRRHAKNLYQGHWQADWINFGRLSLGNAQTDAKVGTGFSWHQSSINPLAIRPGRLARDMVISHEGGASGWYFFTGLSAKWVAWDVLLDGTMFHDSPSVEKEQLVYEGTTHGGYKWKTWSVHYSWIISSPTFEKESGDPDHYGSINFSWIIK